MSRLLGGRQTRPKPAGPSAPLRAWLLDGEHIPEGAEDREAFLDDYFIHPGSAWRQHRGALLAEWIAEHPGSRPYSWWMHDAPRGAARQKLGGSGEESAAWDQTTALWAYFDCARKDPPVVEAAVAFLKRLKLLQPGEEKRIPKAAFRPVSLVVDGEGWA